MTENSQLPEEVKLTIEKAAREAFAEVSSLDKNVVIDTIKHTVSGLLNHFVNTKVIHTKIDFDVKLEDDVVTIIFPDNRQLVRHDDGLAEQFEPSSPYPLPANNEVENLRKQVVLLTEEVDFLRKKESERAKRGCSICQRPFRFHEEIDAGVCAVCVIAVKKSGEKQ